MGAVDPGGGNAHDGQQRKEPEVCLALFGNKIEGGKKSPGGNTHKGRDEQHEQQEAEARLHVVEVAHSVFGGNARCDALANAKLVFEG